MLILADDGNDGKDQIELDSTMAYLSDSLGANLENAELFVILELLQAPTIGEITRKGYVEGWTQAKYVAPQTAVYRAG